jgi:exopolyphosphatase/guanosine-5'-triphosphate,3'-diphosphate pyrophosphatase
MIEEMRRRIREDEVFAEEYGEANRRYAAQRGGLLDVADRARLQMGRQVDGQVDGRMDGPGADLLRVISESGVGGIADWAGVRCLHMNVADYMAGNANPVGELCVWRLAEDGTGLECADGRCVPARVAAINAGSNSAKALVADVVERPGRGFGLGSRCRSRTSQGRSSRFGRWLAFRVASGVRITGLGRGLEQTGRLSEDGRAKTVEALDEFAAMARELGATRIWATATAAARRAVELGDDGGVRALKRQVQEAAGVELEVVSPELEAELSFAGVLATMMVNGRDAGAPTASSVSAASGVQGMSGLSDLAGDPQRVLVVDSGGMSTEFIRMRAASVQSVSLPFGAVNLMERFVKEDPPALGEIEAMREYARERMRGASHAALNAPGAPGVLVVVGGTAATLVSISLGLESFESFYRFDRDQVSGVVMSRAEIERILARLVALPYAERSRIRGMIQPERALVMPAGAAIILGAMDTAGVDRAVMSFAGILDGMAARLRAVGRSG